MKNKKYKIRQIYWDIIGTGKINLILVHGWGFNSQVWHYVAKILKKKFKIYLIDIPGFGKNTHIDFITLNQTARYLSWYMPKKSIWLGWSLGGLIVKKISLLKPNNILGCITVSSSPCFFLKNNWPGIEKNIFKKFKTSLEIDYKNTINDFLDLQTFNCNNNLKDTLELKKILSTQSKPSSLTLKNSLHVLTTTDLLLDIKNLKIPFLRIYGSLDSLIPKKIIKILDQELPNSSSIIIEKAAHIPFLSHKKEFCSIIINFTNKLIKERNYNIKPQKIGA